MTWTNIHTETYTAHGELIKTRLELEGIPCRLLNEFGNVMVYNTSGVVIQVEAKNVQRALELLVDWAVIPELPKAKPTFFSKVNMGIQNGQLFSWTKHVPLLNKFQSPGNRVLVLISILICLAFLIAFWVDSSKQNTLLPNKRYCVVDVIRNGQPVESSAKHLRISINDWCTDQISFTPYEPVVFLEYFNLPSTFDWYVIDEQLLLENELAPEHPFCGTYEVVSQEQGIDLVANNLTIRIAPSPTAKGSTEGNLNRKTLHH